MQQIKNIYSLKQNMRTRSLHTNPGTLWFPLWGKVTQTLSRKLGIGAIDNGAQDNFFYYICTLSANK